MKKTAFNKYNAPELMTQLLKVLSDNGLDDAVNQIKMKKVPQLVNKAWVRREKMAGLRSRVIRLAHEKPDLRKDLLPLLKDD